MRLPALVLSCLLLVASADGQPLTVSAAVSLKESLTRIVDELPASRAKAVTLNFGASGQLLAQIREGAPVDLFISASDEQMDQAEKLDLVDSATRTPIVTNALVLIVPADSRSKLTGFADLADAAIKRLAIGQPRIVPAGMYASQVLNRLRLERTLEGRIIHGSSVRQVLDYVVRGEVDAAIVYATDALSAGKGVRVIATADPAWHDPIRYVAAVIKSSRRADHARAFIRTLCGESAQRVFAGAGFAPLATQPVKRADK